MSSIVEDASDIPLTARDAVSVSTRGKPPWKVVNGVGFEKVAW
jgi:hypothetical protein